MAFVAQSRRTTSDLLRHGQRAAGRGRFPGPQVRRVLGRRKPGNIGPAALQLGIATTYAGLNQLNRRQVGFITIRRRGPSLLARVSQLPADRWRHCQITQAKGKRRQVEYVEEWVKLDGYEGTVRQLIVTGLGHESPTFFLTKLDQPQPQTAREVIQTYATRNHVENQLVVRSRSSTSIACVARCG